MQHDAGHGGLATEGAVGFMNGLDALVRDLTIVRLPGIGHFTPCEAPDAVNSAMRDWLTR